MSFRKRLKKYREITFCRKHVKSIYLPNQKCHLETKKYQNNINSDFCNSKDFKDELLCKEYPQNGCITLKCDKKVKRLTKNIKNNFFVQNLIFWALIINNSATKRFITAVMEVSSCSLHTFLLKIATRVSNKILRNLVLKTF